MTQSASTKPYSDQGETICGAEMPDRLWLVDMGSGDVSWSAEREPDGETPEEAVAYVRVKASAWGMDRNDLFRLIARFGKVADFTTEQDCRIHDTLMGALALTPSETGA